MTLHGRAPRMLAGRRSGSARSVLHPDAWACMPLMTHCYTRDQAISLDAVR